MSRRPAWSADDTPSAPWSTSPTSKPAAVKCLPLLQSQRPHRQAEYFPAYTVWQWLFFSCPAVTQPLPAKAGRFGLLLKQPKVCTPISFSFILYIHPISKLSEWLFSCKSWFWIYALIISSVTFPLLATKYPPAHRCCPQNYLFNSLYSICSFLDVFPFIYCTNLPADRCGGTDTSKCIWSLPTCPASISTLLLWQIIRINSRVRNAICPVIAGLRYFVIHTKWYLISYVQCADFL